MWLNYFIITSLMHLRSLEGLLSCLIARLSEKAIAAQRHFPRIFLSFAVATSVKQTTIEQSL